MGRTHFTDASGNFNLGNGHPILSPSFPILDAAKGSRVSDFLIHRPSMQIEPEIVKIAEQQSEKLRNKALKYNSKNDDDWKLIEILRQAKVGKENSKEKNAAKAKLVKDGKSAVIAEVSKAINGSSIEPSVKFLLSYEPFYVYALCYGIYYEGVKDAEGLNDRVILAAENRIRRYVNMVFARKVIKARHLKLKDSQLNRILQDAGDATFSYAKGYPMKVISKIISKYVVYGDLHALVDKFFESGEIDPAKGTPQVRQLMVNYLMDIGLKISPDELKGKPEVEVESSVEETERREEEKKTPDSKAPAAREERSPEGSLMS